MIIKFLQKLRGVNHVIRWNFYPRVRHENVAEHSFWVATIAMLIAKRAGLDPAYYAMLGLIHDYEESITGDLPFPVKRYTEGWDKVVKLAQVELFDQNGQRDLTDLWDNAERSDVVKFADLFAALLYAGEEIKMGNNYFYTIQSECLGTINAKINKLGPNSQIGRVCDKMILELGYNSTSGSAPRTAISRL